MGVVGGWVRGCADDGFRAVELDNLDSYLRSKGLLTRQHALAFATALAEVAHRQGLAVGQKNAPELAARLSASGYDFAVAVECAEYDECGVSTAAYGAAVVDIVTPGAPTSRPAGIPADRPPRCATARSPLGAIRLVVERC